MEKNKGEKRSSCDSVEELQHKECKRLKIDEKVEDSKTPNAYIKRKMVAVLLAFNGQGYLGMQRNPGVKTIEEEFLNALLKCELIFPDEYETPQNMRFQRSCRTDKGVSAAKQIVSLKIKLIDNVVEKINSYLPSQIRVFGFKRVTRSFNCKTACDARTYSYMLPTFAFASSSQKEDIENYRLTVPVLNKVNEVLQMFQGTHRFHNFTAGKTANDASCQRYIMEFKCDDPFIRDGLEFAIVTVKGQSFMLHQIRKMIGLTIAIVRGLTSTETIDKAWDSKRLDIPIAPSLGLVLEEVHYDRYNKRYGQDGLHEALLWDEYKDELSKFKEDYIYPTIINSEKHDKSLIKWLETLSHHTFDVRNPSPPDELPVTGGNIIASESENTTTSALNKEEDDKLELETHSPAQGLHSTNNVNESVTLIVS